jgi:SAM-dependent methyltransferase
MDQALLLRFAQLEEVHWWFVARRLLVMETVQRWAPDDLARIVEVGCGTGGTLRALSAAFPSATVLGIDPNEEALALARERGCEAVVGHFEDLPLTAGSADLLLGLDVIEHIRDDDRALAEAARALRPGGRLVLTVPALPRLWSPHDEINAHCRRYRRIELAQRVLHAGLRLERLTYFNTLLLPLGVVERAVSRRLGSAASLGLRTPPGPLNTALRTIFGLEAPLLRRGDLPLGMSLLAVATRPPDSGDDHE